MVVHAPVPFGHFVKLLLLLGRKQWRDFLVRPTHGLFHAPAGLGPNLLELIGGAIGHRSHFFELLGRKLQFAPQMFAHALTEPARRMREKRHADMMHRAKRTNRDSREKNKEKRACDLPFQCFRHSRSPLSIALSAIE